MSIKKLYHRISDGRLWFAPGKKVILIFNQSTFLFLRDQKLGSISSADDLRNAELAAEYIKSATREILFFPHSACSAHIGISLSWTALNQLPFFTNYLY